MTTHTRLKYAYCILLAHTFVFILFQFIFMERSSTIAHSWIYRTPVAHLVAHWAETREVVSSRLRPDQHSGSLNN